MQNEQYEIIFTCYKYKYLKSVIIFIKSCFYVYEILKFTVIKRMLTCLATYINRGQTIVTQWQQTLIPNNTCRVIAF